MRQRGSYEPASPWLYRLLGRSRTLRVLFYELRDVARFIGWRRAALELTRLLLALPDADCPRGKDCPARSTCEAGAIRCLKDGPIDWHSELVE
jgi:hypothetical protein